MSIVSIREYDESSKGEEIFFNNIPKKKNINDKSRFFKVINDPNHLIKYSVTGLDVSKTINMISRFKLVKDNVFKTNLPESLYLEDGKISGTVIPYYENSPSLHILGETHSLESLSKVYKHDDDNIHNLFIMFKDILDKLEELKENSICYNDCNPGNFVINNNQVELIDFDPNYVDFNVNRDSIRIMLKNYDELVFVLCRRFELIDLPAFYPKNFKGMQKQLVKVENKVKKNMR